MRRKNHKLIRVFEHEVLRYGPSGLFTKRHYNLLANHHDLTSDKYFSLVRNGVKFKEYVGVLSVGELTIEVLPKADGEATGKEKMQKVLVQMLMECISVKTESFDNTYLHLKNFSILEVYLQLFVQEASVLLRKGLSKKYRRSEGNLTSLKGQLNFGKHVTENLTHKERFYTRYQLYDYDHKVNQILYKTLGVIKRLTHNPTLLDTTGRLLLDFPIVNDIKVDEKTYSGIKLDRKTQAYATALEISRLILLNYHPDVISGKDHVIALMFDMNLLFEEWVYRRLKRYCFKENAGWNVIKQQSKPFWSTRKIRPDIVLKLEGQVKAVVDTKWKILLDYKPDMHDIRQMYAYNHTFKAEYSFLLYPKVNPKQKTASDSFAVKMYKEDKEMNHFCGLTFAKVVDEEKLLNRNFGAQLLNEIKSVISKSSDLT